MDERFDAEAKARLQKNQEIPAIQMKDAPPRLKPPLASLALHGEKIPRLPPYRVFP